LLRIELGGALDVDALNRSMFDLISQHEALRTTVSANGDMLLVWKTLGLALAARDLPNVALEVENAVSEFRRKPFDLVAGPLVRVELMRLAVDRHLLVFAAHPIICDGWSLGVVGEDIASGYRTYARKTAREKISSSKIRDHLRAQSGLDTAYWRAMLNSPIPSLELPVDRARNSNLPPRLEHAHRHIPLELVHELQAMAGKHGASLFTTLSAAFSAQIAHLCKVEKVVLAIPAAGQLADGLERVVGQCTQWLPVQLSTGDTLTGNELLQRAQAAILDAFDHLDCDVDSLVQSIHEAAAAAAKIGFNLDPDPNNTLTRFDPLTANLSAAVSVPLPMELFLNATTNSDGIEFECRYDPSLFDAAKIELWLEMYIAFLRRFAANPSWSITELTAHPDDELARISAWNETAVAAYCESCVQELFEAQAALAPAAIAVSFGDESLNYADLNARANRLAHHLRTLGVLPGSRVAICIDRSLEMVVAIVAVLKAGAAYLPLDPAYPPDRLAHMLADGAPKVLLMQQNLTSLLDGIIPPAVQVLDIRSDAGTWASASPENPSVAAFGITGESLAYVIYTSGSTGMPKGVAMPHRALVNLLHWQLAQPGFTGLKRVLQFAALGFDVAFQEIFSTLSAGGELVLIDEEVRFSPAALFRLIVERRIQRVFLPYIALQLLADGFASVSKSLPVGDSIVCDLREVITAGEQVRIDSRILHLFNSLSGLRLINQYGPTESHVVTCFWLPVSTSEWPALPPIGKPVSNSRIYILDADGQTAPVGVAGELFIGGICVASGYLNRPDLTVERFLPDPFTAETGARMYKTGDLAKWREDGNIEYLGRNDFQVKIRGFRVELGEIEARLAEFPEIHDVAVVAREDTAGVKRLVAYYTAKNRDHLVGGDVLRRHLSSLLPDYMLPGAYVQLAEMPVTPNGKLDRRSLPAPGSARPELAVPYQAPVSESEATCCRAFAVTLGLDEVGRGDNFFELGGSSILAIRVLEEIRQQTGSELSVPALFAHATPAGLAAELDSLSGISSNGAGTGDVNDPWLIESTSSVSTMRAPIAIIAMAGRFPGANSVEALWELLLAGRDGVTRFKDEDLDPSINEELRGDANYVRARGIIDGADEFDAAFFGISPREAEVMDPQHRIFLEIAWECLERAGYQPDGTKSPVGVFAGCNTPSYLRNHVMRHPEVAERVGDFQVMVGNDKDYLASRVAYKLNLKGPAVAINTACSTSLVAIGQAVDSLRTGRCAMAIAGGASVTAPYRSGYVYQEGAMLSADGNTRTFDASATGTTFSDGAAVVLLKRLDDAIADGDQVFAVIRGTATNNDGGGKASFSAPSVDGQAAVIAAAHIDANVDPRSITYVEAHGTATPLGDPIEVEALVRAFRRGMAACNKAHADDIGFCNIGSVKSNIGHLISASGVTGVIKTALALQTETLPASIHYKSPNPKIDFSTSPFIVSATKQHWPRSNVPRLAGVSSFGVGGTNAHVVLQEAPVTEQPVASTGTHLLRLSTRSAPALTRAAENLAKHLVANPDLDLADIAYTLNVGRSRFSHRMAIVCDSVNGAVRALQSMDSPYIARRELLPRTPEIAFVFPGQGAQYASMGQALYQSEPVFHDAFDDCLAALDRSIATDLKNRIFAGTANSLDETAVTQPATFCLEYSLAQWWLSRGVKPTILIGHSVGEFVAAVMAGVMTLHDAMRLVARRGALMQALPHGSMLSVRMDAEELERIMPESLSLAAHNGPSACVIAGPTAAIESFATTLTKDGFVTRSLRTSHAFHSSMMEPAVAPFRELVVKIALSPPKMAIISTLTGKRMQAADATDPGYWASHLREPVRFSPAIRTALALNPGGDLAFLEVGPRGTLSTLIRQHTKTGAPMPIAIPSLADGTDTELAAIQLAMGQLWTYGIELKPVTTGCHRPRRVLLPTYPFERKRFWLEAKSTSPQAPVSAAAATSAALNTLMIKPAMNNSDPAITSTRRPRLLAQLKSLFEDVAGADLSTTLPTASFIEMGLDSLTLTQAAIQLKKSFAVKITFRQLMENYRSFESLAEYLDVALPPEIQPAALTRAETISATPPPPTGVPTIVPTAPLPAESAGIVQQVIQQQMQLMAQQLALLGGVSSNTVPAPTISPPVGAPAFAANEVANDSPADNEQVKAVTYDVKKAFGAIARIHTQGNVLTDRQRARLDAFIRRYVERTKRSKEYTAKHRAHLADPRVVNNFRPLTKEIIYQVVVDKSKGPRVWDIDGNEYVDALNGFGMSLFGWQPDFIQDVIKQQLESGYEIGPMHPLAGDVAQLVCELTGFDRAGLCNTGSEAVMAAIRIARTVTGRSLMAVFTGSYHGTFDEVIVRAGRKHKGIPAAPGIMSEAFGNILVLDYGTPESLEIIREHADELAAVLVEPVQSRRPDFQPKEFLQQVREITANSGTCLIFDEVITGFRSHPGGVQALFGIRADLASYGKVIGGGYPIGVIAGKREYMDALDGGAWQYGDDSIPTVGVTYFAGTFVRHPLALAAAKASLQHMKKHGPQLQADLNLQTAAMADELTAFCMEEGAPVVVKTFASLWRATFAEEHSLQDLLFAMMRSRGVHILDNFPCFLTTAHTPEDIAVIKTAFKESILELQEADLLPRRKDETAGALDSSKPPVPGARLGKDEEGRPAWFVPNPDAPGKYLRLNT